MKKDRRIDKHFGSKKTHTEIKHCIFQDTLLAAMSIARNLSSADNYIYIDLYSGPGVFDDGTLGSPIIALNSAQKIMPSEGEDPKRHFQKMQFVLIDKDEENISSLKKKVNESLQAGKNIEIISGIGEWTEFTPEIKSLLTRSKWGFVFVDPFSTELKLDELIKLISETAEFKDILVLANFNTLSRQLGRSHEKDIKRICDYLNITSDELFSQEFSVTFRETIQEKLSGFGKDFILSMAIPISVDGTVKNSDYFYLILSTSCAQVADAFVKSYEKNLLEYRGEVNKPLPLFEEIDSLKENMLKIIREEAQINMLELLSRLYNRFFSWKTNRADDLPTKANIVKALNKLKAEKRISLTISDKHISKRDTGKITQSVFMKKEYLEKTTIRLN